MFFITNLSANICTEDSWSPELTMYQTEHMILENRFRRQNYSKHKLKENEEVPKQHVFVNNLFELACSPSFEELFPEILDNQM